MKKKIAELKIYARCALKNQYGLAVGSLALVGMLTFAGTGLTNALFGGTTIFPFIMGQIFSAIISLIITVVSTGYESQLLNMARGEKASISDLFSLFQKHPDRIIIVGLVQMVITYILMTPALVVSYQIGVSDGDMEKLMEQTVIMLLCMLGAMLLITLLTMPIVLSYYILIDDLEIGAMDAIKESARMMKGNYGRYLYMLCSFIGLYILGVCSFYIGLLFVGPYMSMTRVEFYRELKGELQGSAKKENATVSVLTKEQYFAESEEGNYSGEA